jgi:predicted flap endonuclease-1-like 5' DNA nuclease
MDWQVFVGGLIAGWAAHFALDYFFWRRRRVCPEVEQELQESVDLLKEEVARLRLRENERSNDDKEERKPDDLKLIWGIGPKVEALFFLRGITTFSQLAASDSATVVSVLQGGGDRFHLSQYNDPASWQEQARLAAAGLWPELEAYQAERAQNRRRSAQRRTA